MDYGKIVIAGYKLTKVYHNLGRWVTCFMWNDIILHYSYNRRDIIVFVIAADECAIEYVDGIVGA